MEPDFDKTVFVIMPFGEEGKESGKQNDDTYENIIKMAVERSRLDLTCIRSDDICRPGDVMDDVITYTVKSKYVIADLSDANPNVFYELGIRDSFDGKTILLCRKGQKLPFDLMVMRTVFYSKDLVGESSKAIEKISTYLTNMDGLDKPIQSPVEKVLGTAAHLAHITMASPGITIPRAEPSREFRRRVMFLLRAEGFKKIGPKPNLPSFEYWGSLNDPCRRPSEEDEKATAGVWYDTKNKQELEEFKLEALSLIKYAAIQNWDMLILVYAFDGVLVNKEAIYENLKQLVIDNYELLARDSSQDERSEYSLLTKPTFSPVANVEFIVFDHEDCQEINELISSTRGKK